MSDSQECQRGYPGGSDASSGDSHRQRATTSHTYGPPHSQRMYAAENAAQSATPARDGEPPASQFPTQTQSAKYRIIHLPQRFTVADIYHQFCTFGGKIDFIRLDEQRPGQAFITFKPPPRATFPYEPHFISVNRRPHAIRVFLVEPRHINLNSRFPSLLILRPSALGVGFMTGASEMTVRRGIEESDVQPMTLQTVIKTDVQELVVEFPAVRNGKPQPHELRIRLGYIAQVGPHVGSDGSCFVVITFQHPPKYRTLYPEDATPIHDAGTQWARDKSYSRITDIDWDTSNLNQVVSLARPAAYIDPGRWLTWKFHFKSSPETTRDLSSLLEIFIAYNVPIENSILTFRGNDRSNAWSTFESLGRFPSPYHSQLSPRGSALQALENEDVPELAFEVRYQLDVAFSKGLLHEGNITEAFLVGLSKESRPEDLLANFVAAGHKCYQPMDILDNPEMKPRRKRRLPKNCVSMHAVTITPTAMIVQPVQVEVSNRVIRRYIGVSDRFLRVRFLDEAYFGKLQPLSDRQNARQKQKTEIYDRVRRTLMNGIKVGGRHFQFLACGNSQFRENGAYFFAPTETINVNNIRQWMGYFQAIREIPKYVSRIGQCFSTTRAVTSIGLQPEVVLTEDIVRNGYTFTDGVGKISPFLAHMISTELRLGTDAPSVYQFRMGGCKGILAVDPTLNGRAVHIRKSQEKFKTDFNQLEIIRVSTFATAYLNKQIILVLSALGIHDNVFLKKMNAQLVDINRALEDDQAAISMLLRTVDYNQVTIDIAKMIMSGLRHEPFVDSLLRLFSAWAIKSLKEKTNLYVSEGAFVLGCVDETASLQFNKGEPAEIFIQIPEQNCCPKTLERSVKNGSHRIIKGTCIITRNPCLHPGDIRIVKAVDVPRLRHLRDVAVLPQTGERDLANMCGGGDLDGDDFLVIWDPDLIPQWQERPMDYTAPKPILARGPVTQSDIIQFFCDFMKNDSLGSIAVAHRAWADLLPGGVKSGKCIKLARLHSIAVDYCKTGVPAQMRDDLKVDKYPHWAGKPDFRSYFSTKVLGLLYNKVEKVEFDTNPKGYCNAFDKYILGAFEAPTDLFSKLRELKDEYDEDMYRIMAQYGIETEFEVYSSFVMTHNREIKDYKFAEEMGRLMNTLRYHYRDLCLEMAGLQGHHPDMKRLGALVVAVYKVTEQESKEYVIRQSSDYEASQRERTPLISFPWVFLEELLGVAQMARSPDKPSLAEAMTANRGAASTMRTRGYSRFDRVPGHSESFGMANGNHDKREFEGRRDGREVGSGDSTPSEHGGVGLEGHRNSASSLSTLSGETSTTSENEGRIDAVAANVEGLPGSDYDTYDTVDDDLNLTKRAVGPSALDKLAEMLKMTGLE
ncbi:hypothetical protein ANO11243_083990 [Dothideomycetidae sp. 11243]|nr:hypothetical protein ANO11243_083990 [fungal sp. No.11243]